MEIVIIAAMAENRVIGKNNALPWTLKEDLARFRELTTGRPCIMGRKTWESLPKKPLPGRLNIVISKTIKQKDFQEGSGGAESAEGGESAQKNEKYLSSIKEAVDFCKDYKKIFICGGESIYRQALLIADEIILTLIPGSYDGDAFFPEFDEGWEKNIVKDYNEFSVITYIKKEFP